MSHQHGCCCGLTCTAATCLATKPLPLLLHLAGTRWPPATACPSAKSCPTACAASSPTAWRGTATCGPGGDEGQPLWTAAVAGQWQEARCAMSRPASSSNIAGRTCQSTSAHAPRLLPAVAWPRWCGGWTRCASLGSCSSMSTGTDPPAPPAAAPSCEAAGQAQLRPHSGCALECSLLVENILSDPALASLSARRARASALLSAANLQHIPPRLGRPLINCNECPPHHAI